MEKLIEILEEIKPGVDYETCESLVTDGVFDSFIIFYLVAKLEDAYNIEIRSEYLTPDNFNSAKALYSMVEGIKEKG